MWLSSFWSNLREVGWRPAWSPGSAPLLTVFGGWCVAGIWGSSWRVGSCGIVHGISLVLSWGLSRVASANTSPGRAEIGASLFVASDEDLETTLHRGELCQIGVAEYGALARERRQRRALPKRGCGLLHMVRWSGAGLSVRIERHQLHGSYG